MADGDVEMTDTVNDVPNHTEAGEKTSGCHSDRSAQGTGAEGTSAAERTDGQTEISGDEMYESCTDEPALSERAVAENNEDDESGTVVDSPEGGGAGDAPARCIPEGGVDEDSGTAMEEDRKSPEGGEAQSGTAPRKAGPMPGGSSESEEGDGEGPNHADSSGNKLLDALLQQPRKSRRVYRRRRQETGSHASDSDSSEDDDNDEDENRGTDSSTRSSDRRHHSHSDSSATESDDEDDGEEKDGSSKSSANELCSDLEDELLAKCLPVPSWRAVPLLRARELGCPLLSRRCYRPSAAASVAGDFCSEAVGSVHLVSRFEKCCELRHHEGCVNTLHFNQSGRLLASGSDDLNIILWDWARQRPSLVYPSGHKSNVFQAKFMPFSGDTTIVSCSRDGQVRVGELSSTGICKNTKKLVQHKGSAHKLALEPDSPVVFLTCGEDAAVFNIDLRTSKATKLVTVKEDVHKVALYTIHLNPMNSHEYCVGGRDHFVRIYDRRKATDDEKGGLVKKFCPHHLLNSETRANVTCSVYSYNGQEILASYNDEDIYLFDSTHSDGAEFIHSYKGHRNNQTVKGVNFYGPQSQFVVSGSDCGNIFLWEKNTEKIVQYMKGDQQGVVNCLEPHPSTAVLATSGLDHDVKIWMPTAAEPTRLDGLKRTMYSNRREREEERSREPDMIDGHMLMFLMQHLRRRARRQAREAGDMDSNSSSSDDSDTSENEDGTMDGPGEHSQCVPS